MSEDCLRKLRGTEHGQTSLVDHRPPGRALRDSTEAAQFSMMDRGTGQTQVPCRAMTVVSMLDYKIKIKIKPHLEDF